MIELRRAKQADVEALALLIEESVRGLGPPHYGEEQIESSLRHLFGVDTAMIEDGTYLVAEVVDRPVGCGGWSRRRTPFGGDQAAPFRDADLRDPARDPAILRAFFVHPDWTRKGVGTRLVRAAEEEAAAAGFRTFELVSTLPGHPLYLALGYQDVEAMQIRLPDGMVIGGFRMRKDAPDVSVR